MSHNGKYYVKKKNKVKSRPISSFLQSTTSSSMSSDSVFQSSIIKDAVPMLSSLTEMITTESSPISRLSSVNQLPHNQQNQLKDH